VGPRNRVLDGVQRERQFWGVAVVYAKSADPIEMWPMEVSIR